MILPSEGTAAGRPWGRDSLLLHRHLLRHPSLLPQSEWLLVAVSGGQDSMALTALLQDLQPLHRWRLRLWHGDHGWRPESAAQADELGAWAAARDLPLQRERADPVPQGEEGARRWRYDCLERAARVLGCRHVVTAHTASDRAETVLLHLARGSHRRGLASLRPSRPLGERRPGQPDLTLVRPLLILSRADTARICRERGLPVWPDSSNNDLRFARNRVRAEVLPVLEALHPGASRRISAQAERLAAEEEQRSELEALALGSLLCPVAPPDRALRRRELMALGDAVQRLLLQRWLADHTGRSLPAACLDALLARLATARPPGEQSLPAGWRLRWGRSTLTLLAPRDRPPQGEGAGKGGEPDGQGHPIASH